MTKHTVPPEQPSPPKRARMTRVQRREQLIGIGRKLFAAHGFDAVSVEEIANAASVSKPVIYEHFGGKEGLYQVIVDRETTRLNEILESQIRPDLHPRQALEGTIVGLLDYIEVNPDGFGLMVHQSPDVLTGSQFSTIMSDMGEHLTELLGAYFEQLGFNVESAPLYGQMLAGMMGTMGQSWAKHKEPSKEVLAAHLVNIMWNGLRGLERDPKLEYGAQEN
ncbi:TetR/AcrR family transcriptional regulator [Trueperella bialowiezensis]|uniref:HTH-type transcriptional repressor KstR2 n=1 Tax=Trueperella bialowiezensis TaxID=312285 RepID=A0A448PDM7_9ACTO|nr:TetR/AcrR family transcriptional regulator [Trueperella bialowiezensis]VEI13027.1 HTH-type transcriptional repressor KstR2 [Trueperella bialowiezensis]